MQVETKSLCPTLKRFGNHPNRNHQHQRINEMAEAALDTIQIIGPGIEQDDEEQQMSIERPSKQHHEKAYACCDGQKRIQPGEPVRLPSRPHPHHRPVPKNSKPVPAQSKKFFWILTYKLSAFVSSLVNIRSFSHVRVTLVFRQARPWMASHPAVSGAAVVIAEAKLKSKVAAKKYPLMHYEPVTHQPRRNYQETYKK